MTDRVSILVLIALVLGASWLAQAHTHVAAQVERITADVQTIKATARDDHDRQVRTESQLEAMYRLTLISVNDHRAAIGKPALPDEFPRGGE